MKPGFTHAPSVKRLTRTARLVLRPAPLVALVLLVGLSALPFIARSNAAPSASNSSLISNDSSLAWLSNPRPYANTPNIFREILASRSALTLSPAAPIFWASFAPGNVVVCRVGDGVAALSAAAAPVFLDEYTAAGALVQSVSMPTADSGANQILTAAGNATTECQITRATNGAFVLVTGYDAAVGTGAVAGTSTTGGTPIVRVIGRVGTTGTVDTTSTTTSFSGGNPRGVTSDSGTNIWLVGSNTGIVYTTFGGSGSGTILNATANNRTTNIFGGQLYFSTAAGTRGIAAVGTGLPTTAGQTTSFIPGLNAATGNNNAFFFSDLDAGVAGFDTLYISDDQATAGATGGGVKKFSLVSGTWTYNGTFPANGSPSIPATTFFGLTGSVSAGTVTLFATRNGAQLVKFVDATGYNVAPTAIPTLLATNGTNQAFRGVAFVPEVLSVSATSPADGATGIATNSAISVTFNTAVDTSSITAQLAPGACTGSLQVSSDNFSTCIGLGAPVASGGNTVFTSTPSSVLSVATTYKIRVTTAAKTATGSPLGATFTQATGFTTGSPGSIQLSSATYSDSETNADHTFDVPVTRTGGSSGAVSVNYSVTDGSATTADNDYTISPASGTLNWANGDSAPKNITITVKGDIKYENNEDINIAITSPGGGATLGSPNTAVLTITNDDAQPDFSIADVSQAELNAGTANMVFTVTKNGTTALSSTVNYSTIAGTATQGTCGPGVDYESASGLLTFSPTDTTQQISVPICGDATAEPDETFTVQLATPSNATISDANATGTIQNDDGAVTYTWDPTSVQALAICGINPVTTNSWICPANWTPLRPTAASASTTDILIFNGTTTPAPTIFKVPNQTIAALQFTNAINEAKFEADGPVTLTVNGNTGSDLSIPAGNAVRLQGTNGITISLTAAGTEGNIAGNLVFQGAAHQLTGANADEIVFQNGSIFTTTAGFSGHPFGSGTFHSVNLAGGSSSFYGAGLDPFGGAGNEVAYFGLSPMSNQEFSAATAFDSNGRNYGNLTLTGGQTYTGSGSGQLNVFGNFELGSTSTLILSSTSGADMVVNGNFTDNNSSLTAFQGNGRIVKFQGGSATQTVFKNTIIGEIFSHLAITKTGGSVQLLTSIAINGSLTFGGAAGSAVDVLELNTRSVSLGGTLGAVPDGNSGFKGDLNGAGLFIGVNASPLGSPIHFVSGGEFLTQFSLDRASGASIDTNLTIGHPTTTPNGILTLTQGVVDMGSNTLALNQNAIISRSTGYVNGNFKKTFPGALAFTLPVGTGTGGAYSPVDVNVTSGAGSSLTAKAVAGPQPNVPVSNKLQRYWTLSETGTVTANLTFHYLATDVVGLEQYYKIFKWDGALTQFNPDVLDTGNHFATLNNVSSFSDWTLAQPSTTVVSLTDNTGSPTNNAQVQWTIIFADPISGLTTSNFGLVVSGLTGTSIDTVVPTGAPPATTWTITASTGSGEGTIRLDMVNDTGLSHAVTNQPFTGDTYTVDHNAPSTTSFTRQTPAGPSTSDDTLVFRATFSEAVNNVDTADFAVNSTSTATVTNVTPVSTSVYDVTVSGGDLAGYNGTVNLNLSGGQNITDFAGNALPAGEPATDETYTVTNAGTPDVSVAVSPANVAEDSGTNLDYTFTRTGSTASSLVVNFTVSGTADSTTDYVVTGADSFTFPNGTVTIPASNSTVVVTVDPNTDTDYETNETVILTVAAGAGYNPAAPTSATGTIDNDDAPPATLVVNTTADTDDGFCTTDPGGCTLREAMNAANASSDASTIEFDIPGSDTGCDMNGVCTIAPATNLPTITEEVVIDAYTQTGATANTLTLTAGDDAVLKIVLDGAGVAVNARGFDIEDGDNSRISGFVLSHWNQAAVWIQNSSANTISGNFIGTDVTGLLSQGGGGNGIEIADGTLNLIGGDFPADRNVIAGYSGSGIDLSGAGVQLNSIEGNYIGTNRNGTGALGNTTGVHIQASASMNTVGCTVLDGDNVISGNTTRGVFIENTSTNEVIGNFIGTDRTGLVALANGKGVVLLNTSDNSIGSPSAGLGNLISGNTAQGIELTNSANNFIQGNFIGTDLNGLVVSGLGNGGAGIEIDPSTGNTVGSAGAVVIVSNNVLSINKKVAFAAAREARHARHKGVASKAPKAMAIMNTSAANIIAGNGGDGVWISGAADTGNIISENSIYSNGSTANDLGIDLGTDGVTANNSLGHTGPNNYQNFPDGLSADAGTQTISGNLDATGGTGPFTIEFFTNDGVGCDTSGNGEGKTFLTSTTSSSGGAFSFTSSQTFTGGQVLTATATDAGGNTSEFSQCFTAAAATTPDVSVAVSPAARLEDSGLTLVYTFTRTTTAGPLTINFSIGGTASFSGGDYSQVGADTFDSPSGQGTVTFTGSNATTTVTVTPTTDATPEPDETVILTVTSGAGYNVAASPNDTATGTIQNDDGCAAPAIVYVDDNWVGTTPGTDPDGGAGPATNFGCDSFATVQGGVTGVAAGGTVIVYAGNYIEDVSINNAGLQLLGAGASTTTISGAMGGGSSTIQIFSSNVTVAGFTITREGNNTTDWNGPLNTAGIAIQGTSITGALIRDNVFIGNRTGIDINNSGGHTVRNNVIDFNRTGMIFRNQTDNMTVVENFITNNWTVGIVFLDGSGGTNSPPQQALNSVFTNNDISANWYGQVVDRQTGGSLPAPNTTSLKNFRGNWWGTTSPAVTTLNSTEPGYAGQIPVAYGGTATPPGGQPDIAGPASANIKYIPFLLSGTDTNVETTPGRGTNGFQGQQANIIVRETNLDGWVPQTSGTATTSFIVGPGTPPLGEGSGQLTVGSDGNSGAQFRQTTYNGTLLSDLTTLTYSTYTANDTTAPPIGDQTVYIILNVDLDGNGTNDTLLFFEPEYQHGYTGTVPDQGDNVLNTWQTWDALAGGWWSTTSAAGADPGANVKPLSTIIAAFPNARIHNSATTGSLRLVAGFGAGAWDNFVGDLDNVTIGVNTATATYDFEPLPRISIDDVTHNEGDAGTTSYTFNVTLSGPSDQTITVNYATADDSATAPSDYTAISTTGITFNPGETSKPVTVLVNGDTTFETNEQFFVNLSGAVNGTILDGQGVGTITNDDAQPTISIGDVTMNEGNAGTTDFSFTVSLSNASYHTVTVNAQSADDTATTADLDYNGVITPLTFTPNTTTQQFHVFVNGDTKFEPNEQFFANLSGATNATILDGQGVGTITNDDTQPTISIDDVTMSEGNAGTTDFNFTVSLSNASYQTVTVNAQTADDTATTADSDYTGVGSTLLTFAPNTTTQQFHVFVNGDTKFEPNEQFFVNLSGATNATILDGQGVGTITNDDTQPAISINDVTMTETNGGTVDFDFTVSISNASYQTVTVNAQTADDTATVADSDYTAAGPTTLTFAPNTTTPQHFHVFVNGDTKFELNDQFFVNLSGETNATILDGQGVGTITNDDTQPTISINDVTMSEGNAGTTDFDFTVSLSNASYQTVTVNAQTADNTATTADLDYTAAGPTTLTFTPNTTTQQFHVFVNGDTKFELNDQFFVNLSGETNATILDGQGVGTITNDDTQPTISINNVTMNEGNAGTTDFDFTVSLSNASYQTITVSAQSADDTATTADLDYAAAGPTTLTFTENTTTQQFHVFVNGDTKFELNDQFFVNLSGATNATILDGQGVGTITNDDTQPTISINDVTLSEGNAGTTNFDFTVTISNASYQTITVSAQTADDTATTADSDYNAAGPTTLTFAANTTTPQTFQVLVNGDTPYELNDQFFVNLSGATNATILDGQGVGTITNDDAAPTVTINDRTLNEGTSPAGTNNPFTFTLTKSGNATKVAATVNWATANGPTNPATGGAACGGGVDYLTNGGTVTFPDSGPGSTTQTVTVNVCRENTFEPNETFVVNLSGETHSTLTDNQGLGTIVNDDSPGAAIVVNTTDDVTDVQGCDATHCSLREAINAVNTSPSPVTINFGIPATDPGHFYYADDNTGSPGTPNGTVTLANVTVTAATDDTTIVGIDPDWANSWWSIVPASALPTITPQTVVVDGYSQCPNPTQCAQVNSAAVGTNAILRIELRGSSAGAASGLSVGGGASTVRGLVINRFAINGLTLSSSGKTITGNFIGSDVSGTLDLGNTGDGISSTASNSTIGGATPDAVNLISNNDLAGISFPGTNSSVVQGNLIGTQANGTSAFGNAGAGISLTTGATAFNTIGGIGAGEGNTIAFNGGDGVSAPDAGTGNVIRGNSIFTNGTVVNANLHLGIDLGTDGVTPNDAMDPDTGPNGLQNFPLITSAIKTGSTNTIVGSLNSTPGQTFEIDFYQSPSCDTAGNGEGKVFIGSLTTGTTNGSGDVAFTFHPTTMTISEVITATATRVNFPTDTSEFSQCTTVVDGSPGAGDIQFTDGTYSVNENGGTASITLTRVGGSNGSISATFTTSNGTADTSDYTDSDQTVTFLENETSKTILVPILDDPVYEGDETVLLALGPSGINAPVTNAPPPDPHAAVLTIVENDPFSISVRDARVAEPASGTAQMLFTVTLQAAAASSVTVDYQTQNGGSQPANGSPICSGLADYVTTSGTLTFAPGERVKTVAVDVCSDAVVEVDETLLLNISNASAGVIVRPQATGTITQTNSAGTVLISELRTSGPAGLGDDFVEIYNNTNTPITVAASDASAGYGLFKMGADCNATPVLIGTIPNGTVIPARGHYLFVGSQYSLSAYASGDTVLTQDIESDRNVALFTTADINELSSLARLDAVGFGTNTGGGVCDLFREGTPLPPVSGSATEHAFLRKLCGDFNNGCETPGIPKDTNNNSEDLMFVDTAGTLIPGVQQRLGAPGPENLASPLRRDPSIDVVLLDVSQAQSTPPNRVRDFTSDSGNASPFGTLSVRRRVVNNTGANVTRLRFRIVELTTFPSPGGGRADLRARNSTSIVVSGVNDATTCGVNPTPCSVTVKGTTLEEPPVQPPSIGGGYNATLAEGTVTIGTPLAPGASTNVQFLLGVKTTGTFRFLIIVEALP